MDTVQKLLKPVENLVEKASSSTVKNPVAMMLMTFLTIVVINCSAHELPLDLYVFLCSPFVRFVIMYVFLYNMTKDVKYSLIGALLVYLIYYFFIVSYENLTLLNDTPEIHPGCRNITPQDIFNLFGGKEEAERQIRLLNIPNGIPINDVNASTVATYLVNNGKMKVSDSCVL